MLGSPLPFIEKYDLEEKTWDMAKKNLSEIQLSPQTAIIYECQ